MIVWLWEINYEDQTALNGAAVSHDAAVRASERAMVDAWQDEDVVVTWDDGKMSGRTEEHLVQIRQYELDT